MEGMLYAHRHLDCRLRCAVGGRRDGGGAGDEASHPGPVLGLVLISLVYYPHLRLLVVVDGVRVVRVHLDRLRLQRVVLLRVAGDPFIMNV